MDIEKHETFGSQLKYLLHNGFGKSGERWTQSEFSQEIGRHKDTISNWVRGKTVPDDFDLSCITQLLDLKSSNEGRSYLKHLIQLKNSFSIDEKLASSVEKAPSQVQQTYDTIKSNINNFLYEPSMRIDIEALKKNFSESDIDKALYYLTLENKVEKKGEMFFQKLPHARSQRKASFDEDYKSSKRKPSCDILDLRILPISTIPEDAQAAFSGTSDLVLFYKTLQKVDLIPHAISSSFIPHDSFPGLYEKLSLGHTDYFEVFKQSGFEATNRKESLHVDIPRKEERELLELQGLDRINVVRIQGCVFSGEKLIEYYYLCDRADLYVFNYEVSI